MRVFVKLLEEVHALRSYLATRAEVGMGIRIYVTGFLHAIYLLGDVVGYRSCWVGVKRLVGVSVRKVCVTFCYIARAVLDNDATTFVGLPDYDVLVLLQFF